MIYVVVDEEGVIWGSGKNRNSALENAKKNVEELDNTLAGRLLPALLCDSSVIDAGDINNCIEHEGILYTKKEYGNKILRNLREYNEVTFDDFKKLDTNKKLDVLFLKLEKIKGN